jgi:hypothetical protein
MMLMMTMNESWSLSGRCCSDMGPDGKAAGELEW